MIGLVIENPLNKTGVGRYTKYLIEILESNSMNFEIIDYTGSIIHSKTVSPKKWHKSILYLLVMLGFSDILSMGKHEVLIFPTASPMSVLSRGNKIVAVHDLMHKFYNFPEVSRFDIRTYRNKLYRSLSKSKVRIVVDSNEGAKHWQRFYGELNKLYVIPFYAEFANANKIIRDPIKERKISPYLFYPAAFWRHKNHKNLVRAVKFLVVNTDIRFKMVFCGKKNSLSRKLQNYISRNNLDKYFEFFDFVSEEELVSLYVNSKGLIFPSYFGPTNIPPLEAISLGVPLAVSDVFSPEYIYGKGILKFNPNNIEEIAEVCKLLLTSNNMYLGDVNSTKYNYNLKWLNILNEY